MSEAKLNSPPLATMPETAPVEPSPIQAELVQVVEPVQGWPGLELEELWSYRNLIYFLGWRDTKLQFKQTVLGAAWAIVQPLAMALIFSLVFGLLFQVPTKGTPYLVFFYTAMVPWTLFTTGVTLSANSVVGNAGLIHKVYFPRLVVPLSSMVPALVDFFFAGIVLLLMLLAYQINPGWRVLMVPAFVLLLLVVTLGVGLWFSALNVRYRDARHLLPLMITLWFYATPVFYSLEQIPAQYRRLYSLNPMVGVVEGFRWSLLGAGQVALEPLTISALVSSAILVAGAYFFRHSEETFADEL